MPVQYTFLGRPMTLRAPPRRFQALFFFVVFFICLMTFLGPQNTAQLPSTNSLRPQVEQAQPDSHLPKKPIGPNLNPLKQGHKPPPPAAADNSTSGDINWYANWNWRKAFSFETTVDENRAVLPPSTPRPPVYTFYDASATKDKALKDAENKLVLIWRKAWWAQGFRPIVLDLPAAQDNPLYGEIQKLSMNKTLEAEVVKWLAWGYMGGGILANWLALPMAAYDDSFLKSLRKGKYPKLERYKLLSTGLYTGEEKAINDALMNLLKVKDLNSTKSLAEVFGDRVLEEAVQGDSIAYYDLETIRGKYKPIADKIDEGKETEAYGQLAMLMTSHLHTTWQNSYKDGIAVLSPYADKSSALFEAGVDIGRNLTQCSPTPLVDSCPPNRKCKPCKSSSPMKIVFQPSYKKKASQFTIGTVPHPYTLELLRYYPQPVSAHLLRTQTGNSDRNAWLQALTKDLVKEGTGEARVVSFKEIVANPEESMHSLWLTAERETHKDLDWIFGFDIPRNSTDAAEQPDSTKPALRPAAPKPAADTTADKLEEQRQVITKAREAIKTKRKNKNKAIESPIQMTADWHDADMEAWLFARAFSGRRRMERLVWEEKEQQFGGAENKKSSWKDWKSWLHIHH